MTLEQVLGKLEKEFGIEEIRKEIAYVESQSWISGDDVQEKVMLLALNGIPEMPKDVKDLAFVYSPVFGMDPERSYRDLRGGIIARRFQGENHHGEASA